MLLNGQFLFGYEFLPGYLAPICFKYLKPEEAMIKLLRQFLSQEVHFFLIPGKRFPLLAQSTDPTADEPPVEPPRVGGGQHGQFSRNQLHQVGPTQLRRVGVHGGCKGRGCE